MEQDSLFSNRTTTTPLASRVRPKNLDDMVGQKHLLKKGKILREMIEKDQVSSMIFWGPPGVGKTTLAEIIARQTKANFITISAVNSGIKKIKDLMEEAETNSDYVEKTILFVDEIHRFNKAQQDAFLPYVEKGSIILIGTTTENPSFEVNSALLSRCKVFVLKELTTKDIIELLQKALENQAGFDQYQIEISATAIESIARFANGDARTALNILEMAILNGQKEDQKITVTTDILEQLISKKTLLYDKNGEEHYNIISALHKSMRNSDV